MNLNQLLWELTKEKFTLHEVNFWSSSKNIYNLLSVMLHITQWNLVLMLHIRQSIYLVLTNVLSTSFLMFHIIFNKISTKLYNSGNFRFTRYMWSNTCSYFGIAFLLFFMKIENTVYTSFLDFWHHEHSE